MTLPDAINNFATITALLTLSKSGFLMFDKIVMNNKTWNYFLEKNKNKPTDNRVAPSPYLYGQPVLVDKYLEDGRIVFCKGDDIIASIKIDMRD